jgi:hypothetical protein
MKKIPAVFQRQFTEILGQPWDGKTYLVDVVTPGCEWVLAGEGIATRKWDGTAIAIIEGKLYARYDAKRGKPAPENGIPCQEPDPITGHWPFWVPAERPEDIWIRKSIEGFNLLDGTYEAMGPKIGGNPEGFMLHTVVKHGADILLNTPRDFNSLKAYLAPLDVEGIVFHHSDGRMAKVTKQGFGLKRR